VFSSLPNVNVSRCSGSECRFGNLKIKELPSTNPKSEEIADQAQGHNSLYSGLDLWGWKVEEETKKHWQPNDTVLHYDGKGKELRTEREFGDAEFIVDFRFPKKDSKPCVVILRDGLEDGVKLTFTAEGKWSLSIQGHDIGGDEKSLNPAGQWNRLQGSLKNGFKTITLNGKEVSVGRPPAMPKKGEFVLRPEGEMDFANLFVRKLS
jgi:hypothetical protein